MSAPVFSIIVPIYNIQKYLDKCIQSILGQSFGDFELILVDDGSPDLCGKIIDAYAEKDSRIKTIHKQNEGLVLARNSGLAIAAGEYIINVDGDDYIMPDMLECIYNHISKTHSEVYCFGYYSLENESSEPVIPKLRGGLYSSDEDLNTLHEKMIYDRDKKFFTFGLCPSVWSRAVKRELFTKFRLRVNPILAIGEDFATTLPIMLNAKSVYIIREPLYVYRILSSSASHKFNIREMTFIAAMLKDFETSGCTGGKGGAAVCGQLGAYIAYVLYNNLCAFAAECDNYQKYLEYIRNMDRIIFETIGSCRYNMKSLRSAAIITITKNKLWGILWQHAKRKNSRKE